MTDGQQPRMIVEAQRYAARGWRVLPLRHAADGRCSCGNPRGISEHDYKQGGKHPLITGWEKEATTDWAQVAKWWRDNPKSNIGIATGEASGIIVLDVDPDNGGLDSLTALEKEHGQLPQTYRVETGSGGIHFYFAWPGFNPKNSAGKLGEGLDIRADGGQVVAPPSVSVKGPYTLRDDTEPAPAPAWLVDMLRPPPPAPPVQPGAFRVDAGHLATYTQKALQAECDAIATALDGTQNDTINRAAFNAGTLVGAGALSEGEAREALLSACRAGNHPEGRAIGAVKSGLTAGMAQPRHPWPPVSRRDDEAELRALIADDAPPVDWSDLDAFAEPDTELAEGRGPDAPPEPTAPPVVGLISDDFYAARPELAHIRQAGHSRTRSGDVALLTSLTRLSGMVSHRIRADTGIAGFASLNLFGGIIGPSGIGKSTGMEVAERLMPAPFNLDFPDGQPIGSGEGLAEMFMDTVEEETGEVRRGRGGTSTPVTRKVRKQVRHNAFIYIDEGGTITRLMKERSGSTLGETLRSAAVGQTLGQTNASKDNSRHIPKGSYSLGLLAGFQPETAAPLFEEVAEGTPQRFLWVQVIDPSIPDHAPPWPGELHTWRDAIAAPKDDEASGLILITFDQVIKDELRVADLAKVRGQVSAGELNPLDSHAPLMRVKLSSLLALLAGRRHVNTDDWRLAGLLWDASCATRDAVLAYSAGLRRLEQEKRTKARIEEEVRVDHAKQLADEVRTDRAVDKLALRIAAYVHANGPLPRKALRSRAAGKEKRLLSDAYDYALVREWLIEADGRFAPGPVPPS